MSNKPWDARIAATIVSPFANSIYVQPNHFTLLRLIVGLAGAAYFAAGHYANTAALLIVFSNFLDHTDGELARMTGKTSRFGHYFDLVSDAVVTISMFIGIGVGLARQGMDTWAPLIGGIAGIAVAIIFHLRNLIEQQRGKAATRQAQAAGFEIEDVLYLLPLVTWCNLLDYFLYSAAIGAPCACAIVAVQYARLRRNGQ